MKTNAAAVTPEISAIRQNLLKMIDAVLESLNTPSNDRQLTERLCAEVTDMREIVQYLYVPDAAALVDDIGIRHIDAKIATVAEMIGRQPEARTSVSATNI